MTDRRPRERDRGGEASDEARDVDRRVVHGYVGRDPAIEAERARRRRHEERAAQRLRERSDAPRRRSASGSDADPAPGSGRRGPLRTGLLATLLVCTAALLWLQRDAVALAIGEVGALPRTVIGRALDTPGVRGDPGAADPEAAALESRAAGADAASPSLEPTLLRRAWGSLRSRAFGPPRIGVQIGHADAHLHPDELASLRVSTGGRAGDVFEIDVNRAVAAALTARLEASGLRVDLLPATVPPGYRADAVVSIHADSSPDRERRGYKSAVFEATADRDDRRLKAAVDAAYLAATRLPDDDENVTSNMFAYYAFNPRFEHAVARRTPALLVELGYISNPRDRLWLERPDALADALAVGIGRFLRAQGRPEGERLLAASPPGDARSTRD